MASRRILSPAEVNILARLASGFIRLVGKTSRWEIKNSAPVWKFFEEGQNMIFAFWHSRFLMMSYIYTTHFRKTKIAVIVSQSRDGELVGKLIEKFDFQPIRGSSTRGGKGAFLGLTRCLKKNWDVAVTPDGPRGPRYQVQDGIINLSAISGVPIVPVSYASTRQLIIRASWDHMRIPLPLGRIKVIFSPPLWVERKITKEQRRDLARELRERLREADRAAKGKS